MSDFINQFPYSDFHEMNLDWIIKEVKRLGEKLDTFIDYNKIKFADPVEWSIARQYEALTLVFDVIWQEVAPGEEIAVRGYNLYMSIKPVPKGINIHNEDYWQLVIPFTIDDSLNVNSTNVVTNQAITRQFNIVDLHIDNANERIDTTNERVGTLSTNLETEIHDRIVDDHELAEAIQTNAANITENTSDITTLTNRVDNLSQTITPGGTTGDAELADIRVGADGITYTNAGNAVRGQFKFNNNLISDIEDNFNTSNFIFENSAPVVGKYMNDSGVVTDIGGVNYVSIPITSDDLNRTLKISGSKWYAVNPYVFVGTSVSHPTLPAATSPYQYTDLEFVPTEPGTLYINYYASGNTEHAHKAYYVYADGIKEPSKLALNFKPVDIGELTNNKILNPNTGRINDVSITQCYVSDYIEVEPNAYYLISTEHFYSHGLFAWYDDNKNFISVEGSEAGGTVTVVRNKCVISPSTAKYLIIGFLEQPSFTYPFLLKGISENSFNKRWNDIKWSLLGDSLTASYGVTPIHYFEYISAATGINYENLAVSGCGYAQGTGNFMTQANNISSDTDIITIFGSGNDASSGKPLGTASDTGTDTIAGCINTTIDNIYNAVDLPQIGIITPTPWIGNMPSDDGFMESYSNLIVEICNRRSIPCLDLFHSSNLNPNSATIRAAAYSRDNGGGLHPDENGHKIIASRIEAFLDSLLLH